MFVSIFCVTVSPFFSRLSVTTGLFVRVFKFFITLSKLFTVSSLVRLLSTVPTSYGKCVRYNRSFGEGLGGGGEFC